MSRMLSSTKSPESMSLATRLSQTGHLFFPPGIILLHLVQM